MSNRNFLHTKVIQNIRSKIDYESNCKSRAEIAKKMHIPNNTLTRIYNGEALPNIDNIIKICKYYNCTSDNLLGLKTIEYSNEEEKEIEIADYLHINKNAVKKLHEYNFEDTINLFSNFSATDALTYVILQDNFEEFIIEVATASTNNKIANKQKDCQPYKRKANDVFRDSLYAINYEELVEQRLEKIKTIIKDWEK